MNGVSVGVSGDVVLGHERERSLARDDARHPAGLADVDDVALVAGRSDGAHGDRLTGTARPATVVGVAHDVGGRLGRGRVVDPHDPRRRLGHVVDRGLLRAVRAVGIDARRGGRRTRATVRIGRIGGAEELVERVEPPRARVPLGAPQRALLRCAVRHEDDLVAAARLAGRRVDERRLAGGVGALAGLGQQAAEAGASAVLAGALRVVDAARRLRGRVGDAAEAAVVVRHPQLAVGRLDDAPRRCAGRGRSWPTRSGVTGRRC